MDKDSDKDSDPTIFTNKIFQRGLAYYNIPSRYPLFKASKTFTKNNISLQLEQDKPYFFGLKNISPDYIDSYEKEYGVIFEFQTTRPLRLLALDDKRTQTLLYNNAPPHIQKILIENYGYHNNIRNSVSDQDRELGNYLCSIGEHGYAIYTMQTDFGGTFHTELFICNALQSVKLVRKVTTDSKAASIAEEETLTQLGKQMKNNRRNQKYSTIEDNYDIPFPKKRTLFIDDDTMNMNMNMNHYNNNLKPLSKSLFDDDDDFSGGKSCKKRCKTMSHKKKCKRKSIRKRTCKKRHNKYYKRSCIKRVI